jgi:hypothetical protein
MVAVAEADPAKAEEIVRRDVPNDRAKAFGPLTEGDVEARELPPGGWRLLP